MQRLQILNLKAFSDIYYSNVINKNPALFSSLLEVGKLRPKKNKKLPQGHTMAEQVKKEILILCVTSHRCSSKVKLRTINIRKSLNQQL